jgi:perosamine synthetase
MIHPFRPNFDWRELLAVVRPGAGRSEFEAAVAARVGARYGVAFAYGRSGMVAAFKALGLTQAEVIIPAYTCSAVAEAVVVSGNRPVFVDIDLADYNIDISAMKDALTSQTRAIIATHMYGYPTDIARIRAITGDDRILIIEDAALLGPISLGPDAAGRRGDIAIFSFGPCKHLYTIRGGIVATNSADLFEKIKAYRDREMNSLPRSVWARRLARLMNGYIMLSSSLFGAWSRLHQVGPMQRARDKLGLARVEMPGDYATAFADFQGRLGLAQLRKFDSVLARHRALAEFYNRELRDVPGISRAPIITGATYSHYPLRVERRDEIDFCRRMRAQGIDIEEEASHDYALPYTELYRPYAKGRYPYAEQVACEVVHLPHYAGLSVTSARHVVESIRRSLPGLAHHWQESISNLPGLNGAE